MKEKEILKEIRGFKDYYISNFGNVYSKKSGTLNKLKPYKDSKKRYLLIKLIKGNQRKSYLVHRLVAQQFIPNPLSLPEVNHKDRNPQNNHLSNLEWCTRKQNLFESYKTMTPVRNYTKCMLYNKNTLVGNFQSVYQAAKFASENYNISFSSLEKYLRCGDFQIIQETPTDRKNKSDSKNHKQYKKGLINLYYKNKFVGQYKSIEEIYREYKKQGITLCKPYLYKYGEDKNYRIERIVNKCND